MTEEHWTLWVCDNCMFHHANGECGDCFREEGHEGGEPLSLLSDHVSLGMMYSEHSEDCLFHIMEGGAPGDYECDCEADTFSKSPCDGCGSTYYGARNAMTEWSE